MIIKKLYLTSFGKFKGEEIKFDDGFNIIYGLNEAGKSTVHKFIEGMLFGFFKPGASRRAMNDSHKKYQPRNSNDYMGSMLVSYQNKQYFIERNFSKSKPSIKITDNNTGTDVTDTLLVHNGTKLPDLAAFFSLDYTMFNNTVSVAQMESETSKDLASVVVEKLTNMHTTKDESISLAKVNEVIEDAKKEIGTNNAKSKPLYLTKTAIESLLIEKSNSVTAYKECALLQHSMSELNQELNEMEQNINQLDSQKSVYKNETMKELHSKVAVLVEEKEMIKEKARPLVVFKELDKEDYETGVILSSSKGTIEERVLLQQEHQKKLKVSSIEIQSDLSEFGYLNNNDVTYIDFHTKHSIFTSLKNELKLLNEELLRLNVNSGQDNDHMEHMKEDYISYRKNNENDYARISKDLENTLGTTLTEKIQLERSLPNGFLRFIFFVLIFVLIGIPLFISSGKKKKAILKDIELVELRILKIQNELIHAKELEAKQIAANFALQEKYKVDSLIEFDILYNDVSMGLRNSKENMKRIKEIQTILPEKELKFVQVTEFLNKVCNALLNVDYNMDLIENVEQIFKTYNSLKTKERNAEITLQSINTALEVETNNYDNISNQIVQILSKNDVANFEVFKEGLKNKELYEDYQIAIHSLETRLDDYLVDKTFDSLKEDIDFDTEVQFDKALYESLLEKESLLRNEYVELSKQRSALVEQINFIEINNRDLAIIESDIYQHQTLLETLQIKLSALELSQKVLDELSEEISYEFAPILNKEVSRVVSDITKGKYTDVKLDRSMDIKVFDNESHKIESIKGFSKGTIDQVYLAMRLGINNVITENVNPFIFDDAFVNYDEDRLKNVLAIIIENAKNIQRQVLLFSCQKRENILLESLNEEYSSITL